MTRLAAFSELALLAGLTACANPPPISASPVVTAGNDVNALLPGATNPVSTQLINAEWNLDQAILVGALPAGDPADACMHSTLTSMGIEPAPAGTTPVATKSFVPRETGLVDTGAALYIQAQQLKTLAGFSLSTSCYAIVGQFVVDAGKVAANSVLPIKLGFSETTIGTAFRDR